MGKSTAQKTRQKLAKEKGYDVHAARRGGQGIMIDTTTKTTKTKKGKLIHLHKKQKQNGYREHGDSSASLLRKV